MSSKSHVRDALADMAAIQAEVEARMEQVGLAKLQADHSALREAVDAYVLKQGEYEDDGIKLTKVQSNTRTWNPDVLETLVPRGVFKNLVKIVVDNDKVQEYVAAKKIKAADIAPAYEEKPKAPYVKWTAKKVGAKERAAADAASLAAKLG